MTFSLKYDTIYLLRLSNYLKNMKNFDRNNRSGGSKWNKGGSGRDFGSRDRAPRSSMHQAICSECGKECEVPFRPTGDRPVFCSNCFEKRGNPSSAPRSEVRSFSNTNFDEKQSFEAICDKCGVKCDLPFKPSSGKPVYCRQCFDKNGSGSSDRSPRTSDQFKQQIDSINYKLDMILKALKPVATPVFEEKKEVKAKVAKTAKVAVKAAPKKVAAKKPAKGKKK